MRRHFLRQRRFNLPRQTNCAGDPGAIRIISGKASQMRGPCGKFQISFGHPVPSRRMRFPFRQTFQIRPLNALQKSEGDFA